MGRCPGPVPVARHHLVATDHDLTRLTRLDVTEVIVDQAHRRQRTDPTRRGEEVWVGADRPTVCRGVEEHRVARQLRHPVPLTELAAELGEPPSQHVDRNRRCAVEHVAKRAEVVSGAFGVVEQHGDHRRGQRDRRHPVPFDLCHHVDRIELRDEHDRPAPQVQMDDVVGRDVEEREREQVDVVGSRRSAQRRVQHRGEHAAVRQ